VTRKLQTRKPSFRDVDASFLQHHRALAAKADNNLCDCWVTKGINGQWYPSVNQQWCRNQGQPGTDTVGHPYPVGTAKSLQSQSKPAAQAQ
jgi:hypothetical protein